MGITLILARLVHTSTARGHCIWSATGLGHCASPVLTASAGAKLVLQFLRSTPFPTDPELLLR